LEITIPANAVDGPLASRFRWGEQGLSFFGPSAIGEVEDYYFGLNFLFGDFNRNGTVDGADYVTWRSQLNQNVTPFSGADGDGDGVVTPADYNVWRENFGAVLPPPGAGALLAGDGSSSSETFGGVAAASAASSSSGSVANDSGAVTRSVSSATVASAPASVSGQAFAFAPAAGGATIVSSSPSHLSVSSPTNSDSNLLVLDLAMGGVDDVTFGDVDESLLDSEQHEETHVSDLALAAVLNEESDWWDAI
jgi:hypothetical protein